MKFNTFFLQLIIFISVLQAVTGGRLSKLEILPQILKSQHGFKINSRFEKLGPSPPQKKGVFQLRPEFILMIYYIPV